MNFHFKADCTFEAKDLDGAFAALEGHFRNLQGEEYDGSLLESGSMNIEPLPPTLKVRVHDNSEVTAKFGG